MIILDTHTLVWWLKGASKLSPKARREVLMAWKKKSIYISSISVWEIALLVSKGKLDLNMEVGAWVDKLERLISLNFVPVDNNIAVSSVYLPGFKHKDPADRIIIATARHLGAKLITSDKRILKYKHVRAIW
jgi:PIN domain nuclease of toxin-antitoxin system